MVSIDRIMIAEIVGLHMLECIQLHTCSVILLVFTMTHFQEFGHLIYRRINNGSKDDLHDIKIKTLFIDLHLSFLYIFINSTIFLPSYGFRKFYIIN